MIFKCFHFPKRTFHCPSLVGIWFVRVKGVFLNFLDLGCSVVDQHLQAGMGDHEVYDELTDYWDDGSWGVEAEMGDFLAKAATKYSGKWLWNEYKNLLHLYSIKLII